MSQSKKNALYTALTFKCPNCGETSMFENPSIYTFTNMGKTKDYCDHCGVNLKPETGFYFGAAYVSWGLTVALWISVLVALKILDAIGLIKFGFLTHPVLFLSTGMIATAVLFPYLFRLSRSVWAHMFIKPSAKDRKVSQ